MAAEPERLEETLVVLGAGAQERETNPPAYELRPFAIDTYEPAGEERLSSHPQTAFRLRQIEFLESWATTNALMPKMEAGNTVQGEACRIP
ncbi:hypothetical protein INS49_002689 [Diaporthe citri]|uniref:uncharacterized protein n=1 Tax=Diaporthe citri TaxID=83186 RepID=UPI001C7FB3EB|nr:uncharacterized protein INS49_002689 [Diaporthe citri]KAG6368480.1 hypothetical protein INS49_002689 [Diaporthe citri]